MKQTLKISDPEMLLLRQAATLHSRSLAGQAEYWMRLGRSFESNVATNHQRVRTALQGLISVDALSVADRELFFPELMQAVGRPGPNEEAHWADRRARGVGVGLDAGGKTKSARAKALHEAGGAEGLDGVRDAPQF